MGALERSMSAVCTKFARIASSIASKCARADPERRSDGAVAPAEGHRQRRVRCVDQGVAVVVAIVTELERAGVHVAARVVAVVARSDVAGETDAAPRARARAVVVAVAVEERDRRAQRQAFVDRAVAVVVEPVARLHVEAIRDPVHVDVRHRIAERRARAVDALRVARARARERSAAAGAGAARLASHERRARVARARAVDVRVEAGERGVLADRLVASLARVDRGVAARVDRDRAVVEDAGVGDHLRVARARVACAAIGREQMTAGGRVAPLGARARIAWSRRHVRIGGALALDAVTRRARGGRRAVGVRVTEREVAAELERRRVGGVTAGVRAVAAVAGRRSGRCGRRALHVDAAAIETDSDLHVRGRDEHRDLLRDEQRAIRPQQAHAHALLAAGDPLERRDAMPAQVLVPEARRRLGVLHSEEALGVVARRKGLGDDVRELGPGHETGDHLDAQPSARRRAGDQEQAEPDEASAHAADDRRNSCYHPK
jgi:hypothetical protein